MVVTAIARGVKDSQVLQALLTPHGARSPMLCGWSQDRECGIRVAV